MRYNQLLDFINFVQIFHPAVNFTYEIPEKSKARSKMLSTKSDLFPDNEHCSPTAKQLLKRD